MKIWLLIFILSSLTGFALGKYSRSPSTEQTNLSSTYVDLKDEAAYECPTEAEYKDFLKQVNFSGDFPLDCNNPTTSKLGRALKFLSKANLTPPDKWVGANDALQNPLKFLSTAARTLKVDLSRKDVIASNQNRGDIFLASRFFANDTLDSVVALLHEARHSSPLDPGHAICRWGDLAGTTGGCDQTFGNDERTGAYAYAVLIGVAWAKYLPGLTQAQREFLLSTALYRLATRFNVVPNTLAVPVEQIFVLDEDGTLFPVSPLNGKLLSAVEAPHPFTRINFYNGTNGFMAYTGSSSYLYRPSGTLSGGFFSLKNLTPIPLRDIASMLNKDGNDAVAYQYFITTNNELKFLDTDPNTGERAISDSPYQPKNFGYNVLRLAHARRKRYALTDKHQVVYLDDDQTQIVDSSFQDANGFRQIDGGLFYTSLIGVTGSGEVKMWNNDTKKTVAIDTPFSAPVLKTQQTVSFTAGLLQDNKIELHFWDGSQKLISIDHQRKIIDMVITRSYQMSRAVFGTTILQPQLTEAVQTCDMIKAFPGIWSTEIVGVNRAKKIITFNSRAKTCSLADLSGFGIENTNVETIDLLGSDNIGSDQALSYPLISVKKSDGASQTFKPYKFK